MRKRYIAFALGVALVLGGAAIWTGCQRESAAPAEAATYYCPMHPQYTSDRPGDCPVCNMKLVPMDNQEEGSKPTSDAVRYQCPMHPDVTSDKPGNCPVCGMKLERVQSEPAEHSGHDPAAAEGVSGHAPVVLTAEKEQRIGVRLAEVRERPLTQIVRAAASVAYDPDLYAAMTEYRQALETKAALNESSVGEVQERSSALVDGARLRLRQLGLSDHQIRRLANAKGEMDALLLPGKTAWIYAQVYAHESPLVREGQPLEVTSTALPGRRFSGRVLSIDPIVNAETRTLTVRAEVENRDEALKPQMYVDAHIHSSVGDALAVPKEAVLHTGARQIVYVKTGEHRFEPREVRTGREAGDYHEVISGLEAGEMVAASGVFLIDSESRIRAARSGAPGHQH